MYIINTPLAREKLKACLQLTGILMCDILKHSETSTMVKVMGKQVLESYKFQHLIFKHTSVTY